MPTIKDVARVAGVSVTTVSRVLNNKGYISTETKEKVHAAMHELNYEPNEIARSLFRKKSNVLGLIIPNVAHPYFAELTSHIEAYAQTKGYKILLCNSLLDIEKEKEYIQLLKSNQVDGIIMGSHSLDTHAYTNLNFPIVSLDRQIDVKIPYVCCDNDLGGALATTTLIEAGCKKIAHISGSLSIDNLSNQRYLAFERTCLEANIDYLLYEADVTALQNSNYGTLVEKLFSEHPDIDGLFASSDVIATQFIKHAMRLGKNIPHDLKVIGFDDTSIATLFTPELTTVRQPIQVIARYAVDLILRQLNDELVPNCTILPVELIKRETC